MELSASPHDNASSRSGLREKLLAGQTLQFKREEPEEERTIMAEWLREACGVAIDVKNAVIRGPLEFRHVTFKGEFSLIDCNVQEFADLSYATFKRNLILSGTSFHKGLSLDSSSVEYDLIMVGVRFLAEARANFTDLHVHGVLAADRVIFEKLVDVDLLRARFDKDVFFREGTFTGGLNLTDARVGLNLYLDDARLEGSVSFRSCLIGSDAIFGGAHFGSNKFDGIIFDEAEVKGSAHFQGARFTCTPSYTGVRIGGDAHFEGTVFEHNVEFKGARIAGSLFFCSEPRFKLASAIFKGRAEFAGVRVDGQADFQGAVFEDEAAFTDAEFKFTARFEGTVFAEASYIGAQFCGRVSFREGNFQGRADFSEASFGGEAYFAGVTFQEVEFFQTKFKERSYFDEVKFQGEASFHEATFCGHADFSDAQFRGRADFFRARFQSDAEFWGAQFGLQPGNQPAYFREAFFERLAGFESARFWNGADFNSARLLGSNSFQEAVFGRGQEDQPPADFSGVRFAGATYFERISTGGPLVFLRAEFGSSLFIRGPFYVAILDEPRTDNKTLISPSLRFQGALFEKPKDVRFENMDLTDARFARTNVRHVEFRNVIWPKRLWEQRVTMGQASTESTSGWRGRAVRFWCQLLLVLAHNTVADEFAAGDDPQKLEHARRVCRDLKATFEDQRDYADAGDFYYAEMELRRRQLGLLRGSLLWLYWLVCGYAEKPLRTLLVFSFMWLLLAGLFTRTEFKFDKSASWRSEPCFAVGCQPSFKEALGHSIRSLTLQQRGGYLEPYSPWAHHLMLAANLIGPVQLALFGLAMRHRFRR